MKEFMTAHNINPNLLALALLWIWGYAITSILRWLHKKLMK